MNIMQESKDTCKSGDATKCFNLAFLYDFGEGVEQDKLKAIELYTQACDLGYAGGCLVLGAIYHAGENVKKDVLRAKRLYSRACDEGSERGCKEYSILKVNEKLVSK
ncbi:MAG: sel1 repeat family protein [Sulfurovum sp.]|nr:sel1 repeat family protein [Sulfurovum sp.]